MAKIVGLDLGKKSDPSALAVVDQHGVNAEGEKIWAVPALHRWELGTSYTVIVQEVVKLCSMLDKPILVIDHTGPGIPIFDMFVEAFQKPTYPPLDQPQYIPVPQDAPNGGFQFLGQAGKDLMIRQGYVPPTCTLPADFAGALIYSEVSAGRSPCWACSADRSQCKGQPKRNAAAIDIKMPVSRSLTIVKQIIGVTFTFGEKITMVTANEWHVAKKQLVGATARVLDQRRLRINVEPKREHMKEQFLKEMLDFTEKKKATTGNPTFEAWRESTHDDVVFALSLGLFWAEKGEGPQYDLLPIAQRIEAAGAPPILYPCIRYFNSHKNFQPMPVIAGRAVMGCPAFGGVSGGPDDDTAQAMAALFVLLLHDALGSPRPFQETAKLQEMDGDVRAAVVARLKMWVEHERAGEMQMLRGLSASST